MKWLLLFFFILIPNAVFGQDGGSGLVSCTGATGNNPCDFCDFITMVNNIVLWLFGVLASIAVLGLVIAGIRLVISAGNPAAMTAAKEMFSNIIIGFVIVLSAWLIVDTVIKTLVGENSEFGMWNQFDGDCGEIKSPTEATDFGNRQSNPGGQGGV